MDNKIKNYIKDINKLIDGGMGPMGEGADEEDDDEDDDNIEEVPTVPETDENSKSVLREDDIEDDGIEESKVGGQYGNYIMEESKLMDQLALPPEPFRLDELRISAPMLRNELSDSLAFFESMLVENYGHTKFR